MAFLRELIHKCSMGHCRKRAVVEVINYRNASYGDYCRDHGQSQLRMLKRTEMEEFNATKPGGR